MRIACLLFLLLPSLTSLGQKIKKDSAATAQKDSSALKNDTTKRIGNRKIVTIETYAKRFDPNKALFYSAVLPGAGQDYNKKYWKIPLVFGGFWGLLAVVKYYNGAYVKYQNQLYEIINYPNQQLYPGITNAELDP